MYVEKIKYLKESIMTETLKNKLLEVISKIKEYENSHEEELNSDHQDSYEFKVLINEIFNYFYELSSSIFDNFVCEGGDEEYSYKSFKLFYINIYYSFLKEFFVENSDIKNFFSKVNKIQYQKIYATCEDSLFNFIAHYFFTANSEYKPKIEHILNNIIQFDCDTPEKEKRYKRILFIHYKESLCNEIKSYMEKIEDKMKDIHKEITMLKIIVKILKTHYFIYNTPKGLATTGHSMLPSYFYPKDGTMELTRDSLLRNANYYKDRIKNKCKEYSDVAKVYKTQSEKYVHAFDLTQEQFEKGQ